MATADGISTEMNKHDLCKCHESGLLSWSSAYRFALLIQPSYAAPECAIFFLQF